MSKYSGASAGNLELEKSLIDLEEGNLYKVSKNVVFTGGTANTVGDHDGTADPTTLFTVTGDVLLFVFGVCKTTLVGTATLEVGVTGATAVLIAQIADATALAENEGYWDATPTLAEGIDPTWHVVGGGLDVIMTLGTANVTAGEIDFYCYWKPLSETGNVVAA